MRKSVFLLFAVPAFALAQPATPAAAGTELKVGTGIENKQVAGEAKEFTVAAGTKIYAWARVSGVEAGARVAIVFKKGDKEAHRQELSVPSVPYRTNAYKTFRKGDGGDWTVSVLGPDGKELATIAFKVEISG